MENALLKVKNLKVQFNLITGTITAVDGISFDVGKKEILAIVGESGCGKSVTILSILKLIEEPGIIGHNTEILFEDQNLLDLKEKDLSAIRGNKIGMIFQEPQTSFNLLFKVGYQIRESLKIHKGLKKAPALEQAVSLLKKVHIPAPEHRVNDFPFQLSGGMLQRVMTALALSCNPLLLLADEPTTSLDVTIQSQILGLLKELADNSNMSIIFVTHDMALIDNFADRVLIMYAGRILESCSVENIFKHPKHPYTKDLLKAIPRMGVFKDETRLFSIKGKVPEPANLPDGCKYAPRCELCFEKCRHSEPELTGPENHKARCFLFEK